MEPQLKDGIDFFAGFLFVFKEGFGVAGIEHERFFADDMGTVAQSETDVCVVEVIGRTDADIVDGLATSAQFFYMSVEAFKLGEEGGIGEPRIHDAHGVVGIVGCHELVAGVADGFEVPGSDVAGCADERKNQFTIYECGALPIEYQ